jgi:hypothetical protein
MAPVGTFFRARGTHQLIFLSRARARRTPSLLSFFLSVSFLPSHLSRSLSPHSPKGPKMAVNGVSGVHASLTPGHFLFTSESVGEGHPGP